MANPNHKENDNYLTDAENARILDKLGDGAKISSEVIGTELEKMRKTTVREVKKGLMNDKNLLSAEQKYDLIKSLKDRFYVNEFLHKKIKWIDVRESLENNPAKLWSLLQLELTGGEPDVIGEEYDEFIFGDCSMESPVGRRDIVYDAEAQKYLMGQGLFSVCNGNAVDIAGGFHVDLMDEVQYRSLQKIILLDLNTWSWLKTPWKIRKLQGKINF